MVSPAFFWIAKGLIGCLLWYKHYLARAWRRHDHKPNDQPLPTHIAQKSICVQIPLYCEAEDAAGVLEATAALEWPHGELHIQVLNDSPPEDSTTQIVASTIEELRKRYPQKHFHHLQRKKRQGYKAGALAAGMAACPADYFAIFDADFRPEANFLVKMMTSFGPGIGAVQAIWSYDNSESSLLTRMQRLMLHHHFYNEQFGRFKLGLFFNFNGTAGIWRREAIEAGGGWKWTSVTEDMLLSYRSQLQGWNMVLRPDITCQSSLPGNLAAFLIQQRRWAKGNGQVCRQLAPLFVKKWGLRDRRTYDVFFHLCGYGVLTLLLLGFLVTPWHIASLAEWYTQYTGWHWSRIMELVLWSGVTTYFFALFNKLPAPPTDQTPRWAHSRLGRSGYALWERVGLLLCVPLFAILISFSFWQGLIRGGSRPKDQVFHRTPKSSESLKKVFSGRATLGKLLQADLILVGIATLLATFFSGFANASGFYFASGFLLVQALLFAKLAL